MELRRISKNGNSLQIFLPRAFLRALRLKYRDVVGVELVGQTIVISRVMSVRRSSTITEPASEAGDDAS